MKREQVKLEQAKADQAKELNRAKALEVRAAEVEIDLFDLRTRGQAFPRLPSVVDPAQLPDIHEE